ncbi:MAG: hypothetical protein AVDCRST_MAG43-61 [uncultured Thermomicrobiales bacterium]|uniref:Acyltransferase n=1 Tax=uncultured Thermomicrobiales bacterium TaxID=1645740 RepID=A0A6J4U6T6_9BACT|nr:MAG: hypothetical protein AVDCRST_MAG43-61 [uncultured Thermomicrobiales bacterium]
MTTQTVGFDTVEHVREALAETEPTRRLLDQIEDAGSPQVEIGLPHIDDLPHILLDLAVPQKDINPIVAMMPTPERTEGMCWLVERCAWLLVRDIGSLDERVGLPDLPESFGPIRRYFYVYVFVATLPHVQAYCRAREIPDDTLRHTLMDLGRKMALHRRRHGVGGFDLQGWLTLHFRGAIFDLGRLQFQPARLGARMAEAMTEAGLACGPDDLTLSVHITNSMGPMSPSACGAAFERARSFFARHFPEESYRTAVCHSWLLDDQLGEYLPESSNIIRFQRRFKRAYRSDADDLNVLRFVFDRVGISGDEILLDDLPQTTHLERSMVRHLRSGRHWYGATGWLEL